MSRKTVWPIVLWADDEGPVIEDDKPVIADILPGYITPERYKEITGEDYPEEGPVWYTDDWRLENSQPKDGSEPVALWVVKSLKQSRIEITYTARCKIGGVHILCAIGNPNPPSADWRKNERKD